MENIISYKLEGFEGPLDLLLQLIAKNKLNIYDIQLLPYCPLDNIKDLWNMVENEDYDFIKDNATPANVTGIVYYISSASFQQRLEYS